MPTSSMPELPEVETIRRDLEREVVGKRIKTVEVNGTRSIRRHKSKKEFIARLEGAKIIGRRPARASTCCSRSTPATVLVVHLRHERPAAPGPGQGPGRRSTPTS